MRSFSPSISLSHERKLSLSRLKLDIDRHACCPARTNLSLSLHVQQGRLPYTVRQRWRIRYVLIYTSIAHTHCAPYYIYIYIHVRACIFIMCVCVCVCECEMLSLIRQIILDLWRRHSNAERHPRRLYIVQYMYVCNVRVGVCEKRT